MSFLLTTILTGIGLSMDAFSLAIIYGTLGLSKRKMIVASLAVGLYHFFMPLFGFLLGDLFLAEVIRHGEFLVGAIFTLIAVEMLLSYKKEEQPEMLQNFWSILLFGFTVSLDSFSVGIGFGTMEENMMISAICFSLISAFFTYFGLTVGRKLSKHFGKIAILIGSFILLGLAFQYFFFS